MTVDKMIETLEYTSMFYEGDEVTLELVPQLISALKAAKQMREDTIGYMPGSKFGHLYLTPGMKAWDKAVSE